MARIGCRCGAEMTNSVAPSQNIMNIFYKAEAVSAIQSNSLIRLWDFYTGWDEKNNCNNTFQNRTEPVEYWYCTECKRVYEVQAKSCGSILRVFCRYEAQDCDITKILNLPEIIVLTDIEMDTLLSLNENLLLKDYLCQDKALRYFISGDEKVVYVVNSDKVVVNIYRLEEPDIK